jgi:aspartyl-tRNA(Asn)/glutamyl-tRNA(Gln) amidotransferase subunit A
MPADLHHWPVRVMSRELAQGRLTASALLAHCRERIEQINPALNAFIALDPTAKRAADESDARLRAGKPRSPLEGIPVAVKDNLLMRGLPASWGSRLFADRMVEDDELPVARLRAAGAVLVGKTNVPEFSLQGYTGNPVFGVSRNPWDVSKTPGGSSGGAAAALAAGLVPLALCTDGGGSIRRPAAHTGLVGLKPSIGRVPRHGGFPALLSDCEVVGPMARTTDDIRLMLDCLAGPSRADLRSRAMPLLHPPLSRSGLRVLYVDAMGENPVDPEIRARCAKAAERIGAMGHEVTNGKLPFAVDDVLAAWSQLGGMGLAMLARVEPGFARLASPSFVAMADAGAGAPASRAIEIMDSLQRFRAEVGRVFATVDVIATPCTAAQPWAADVEYPAVIDGRSAASRGHAIFTGWVNACGHPAISIPVEPDSRGMPIGLQLVGDFGAESLLLDLAAQFEADQPWAARWPAMD